MGSSVERRGAPKCLNKCDTLNQKSMTGSVRGSGLCQREPIEWRGKRGIVGLSEAQPLPWDLASPVRLPMAFEYSRTAAVNAISQMRFTCFSENSGSSASATMRQPETSVPYGRIPTLSRSPMVTSIWTLRMRVAGLAGR